MAELVENLPPTYPADHYVHMYADVATGVYRVREVVKVYFATMEGDVFGRPMGPAKAAPAGQLVMPTDAFIGMVAFLESYVQTMVDGGVISKEYVQEKRGLFDNLKVL